MSAFKAPWGMTLKVISFFSTGFFLVVAVDLVHNGLAWVGGLVLTIPLIALPFIVRGYVVQERVLKIRRLFWETRIDLTGLRTVQADPSAWTGSFRICGNGGQFSFTGWYWSRRLGRYRAFATDLPRSVVLAFDTRRIIVTPDAPAAFVAAVKPLCAPREG